MGGHRSVRRKGRADSASPRISASADGAKLKLTLQPYVRLLSFRYPVDDLLLEVRKEDEDTDFASNTFAEHRKRKRVRAVAKLKPAPIFLAVHRIDYSVYFRRLDAEEFAILTALRKGKTLSAAVAARASQERDSARGAACTSANLVSDVGRAGVVLPSGEKTRGKLKFAVELRIQIRSVSVTILETNLSGAKLLTTDRT